MDQITSDMLDHVVGNVTFEKRCTVSRDDDAKRAGISKSVDVTVTFNGCTLRQIFDGAMSPTVIKWQRTARARYDDLPARETVHYNTAGQRDPKQVMLERAKTMSPEELQSYMDELKKIAQQ